MREQRLDLLMDKVTKALCPFCFGLAKRNCLANNCMAWRLKKVEDEDGNVSYVGWCGMAGKPAQE